MRRWVKPLTVLVGITAAVALAHAAARVQVEVYPRVAMAPATLKLTARVERHPDNRLLRISLDCERFYAASEIELEGDRAPRTHQLPLIEGIPAGPCVVLAEVATVTGQVLRSTAVDVEVVGGEPRP
jgi:hypothetical protein